jgi:hypothetical protein
MPLALRFMEFIATCWIGVTWPGELLGQILDLVGKIIRAEDEVDRSYPISVRLIFLESRHAYINSDVSGRVSSEFRPDGFSFFSRPGICDTRHQ